MRKNPIVQNYNFQTTVGVPPYVQAEASLQGPKSRAILQSVCAADLSAVPFYGMIETEISTIPVVITRTGYTTELGYEIFIDVAQAADVFSHIWNACEAAGGRLSGSGVMDIRRIEAGLLDFSSDYDWRHTPYQVGLGWMINPKKYFFHCKDALLAAGIDQPVTRLAGLQLEGEAVALKGDKVLFAGQIIGEVTSGAHSPSLEVSLVISMIGSAYSKTGTALSVMIEGIEHAAAVVDMPFFDPERKLAKA